MRAEWPSLTASIVSLARGLGPDPVAERLLAWPFALALRALRDASARASWAPAILNAVTLGVLDHVVLRTAEIDAAVRAAVEAGVGQLVLLGAGLDARAYRMPELAQCTVIEIDHPATQAYKRARIAGIQPLARAVRFQPVNFERDDLKSALAAAGHSASTPTIWVWEGVTMYLQPEAIRATLRCVAELSAPGSRLAMTYATPDVLSLRKGAPLAQVVFHALGEPLLGLMSKQRAAAELEAADFHVLSDGGAGEWALTRAHARRWALMISERLVVAELR